MLESEREIGDLLGVVGQWGRDPAGDHVAVPNRFDLLETVGFDVIVEDREHVV